MPTVTIKIANPLTPLADGTHSLSGHIWYSLNDGNGGTQSFGFSPDHDHEGQPFAPGEVNAHGQDDNYYTSPAYTATIEITQAQYDKLKAFGEQPKDYGFDTYYSGIGNSCVDFVWSALKQAELVGPYSSPPNALPTFLIDDVFGIQVRSDISKIINKIKDLFDTAKHRADPMILDLDGDGVETLNVQDGIHFDHDGNGFKETTGWVGKDDGLLVRDLNGNGVIDNGHELFGDNTLLADGSYANNGFSALADLDSNHDGKLSSADTKFSQLRIWKDTNSNGITDAGELLTLSAAGVQSIATGYSSLISIDFNGNQHQQAGTYTTTVGATRSVDDVWFAEDTANTINTTTVSISAEIAELPEIEGFGGVPSLRQAMALDASGHLKGLVQSYAVAADDNARETLLQQIIFAWAGVESIAPNSRGSSVADARTVAALEAFMGQAFIQASGGNAGTNMPNSASASDLLVAFNELTAYVGAQLMAQTNLESIFDSLSIAWSADSGALTWDIGSTTTLLQAAYDVNSVSGTALLKEFADSLKSMGSSGEAILSALRAAGNVSASGFQYTLALITSESLVDGTAANNNLTGGTSNDLILGRDGNDSIWAGDGDDVIEGGAGNDYLSGGNGSDIYLFGRGDGQDTINNFDNSVVRIDRLELQAGIGEGDILLYRSGDNLLLKIVDSTDQVTVENYFLNDTNAGYALDAIHFSGGATWDRETVNQLLVTQGGSGADTLTAFSTGSELHGYAGDDALIGAAGNDSLLGDEGNDSLVGNAGNDVLYGDAGDDTLYGGTGNDELDGGAGNDHLVGGAGNDTYLFGRGSGIDTIDNYDISIARYDVLQLTGGLVRTDVVFERAGDSLIVSIAGSSDQVTISDYFAGNLVENYYVAETAAGYALDAIRFSDGTVMDRGAINNLFLIDGTAAPDYIHNLFANDQIIHGYVGNDDITSSVGNDHLFGDDGNDYIDAGPGADVVDGGAGDDELRAGSGNDALSGGDGNDILSGGTGNDVMDGGSGRDVLQGGDGDDIYQYGSFDGSDTITDTSGSDQILLKMGTMPSDVQVYKHSGSAGGDLVLVFNGSNNQLRVSGYFTTTSDNKIERIVFANGTVWDVAAIAARVVDLSGGINGQSGTGADDTFQVDNVGDTVAEAVSAGTDTIISSVSYVLPSNVENLTLQGIFNIDGKGNAQANLITGNQADNFIDGRAGVDTMIGGAGDDTYTLDDSGGTQFEDGWKDGSQDVVQENAGEGYDTVLVASYSASLANNVERLVALSFSGSFYTANAGTDLRRRFVGNNLDNVVDVSNLDYLTNLYGTYLDGGLGADTLLGGSTNDTYVVDNVGDVIIEGGVLTDGRQRSLDTVLSSISYTLGDNLENLTLLGSAAISGTGNALNNILDGSQNISSNILLGGLGNDTYQVDTGDVVVENSGEGIDTVNIMTGNIGTYYLSSFAEIENLQLGVAVGASSAVGNEASNLIVGNLSANSLYGGSGDDTIRDDAWNGTSNSASDLLFGEDGNDTLYSYGGYDVLDGGAGDDLLVQMAGNGGATYVFGKNYGHDTMANQSGGGYQVLRLNDVSPSEITFSRDQLDLVIGISGDAGSMRVAGFFVDTDSYTAAVTGLQWIQFPDGTQWNQATVVQRLRALGNLTATSDADVLGGTTGGDVIDALAGNDVVYASGGNDSVEGSSGNDELWGELGNDTLSGGADDDTLYGGDGNDSLTGGAGNDVLHGGSGADSYVFNAGSGQDVIQDTDGQTEDASIDEIVFGTGVNSGDIQLSTPGVAYLPDLTIKNAVTGDQITISGFFGAEWGYGRPDHIERIRFADGTTWNLTQIQQMGSQVLGTVDADMLSAMNSSTRLYGLDGNDSLYGGDGNDVLDGGSGNDTLMGFAGDDVYVVDSASDVITENASEGIDTVQSTVTYTLGANLENLTLIGTAAINGIGNSVANIITGNSGNNTLDGKAGADTLSGGAGNDTYVVDNVGDVIIENANEGTDLVQSSVTYSLSANVENLTLTGTSAINATGNALANTLAGNSGANILDGGAGADSMSGGTGNDNYVVDDVGDVVTEAASAGTDLVQSYVTYTLGSNVENLTLLGTSAISGVGNTLVNTIIGNNADNAIDGGAGADTMRGGLGNDTYVVDSTSDVVTENANEGTDLVQSSVTYTIGSNVENLTLMGTSAINGTGNTLANVITGNSANNTLDGGAGSDTMIGGAGNDTYVVDNAGDIVTENASEGTDLVQSSVSYTLSANVENLTLTGTGAINATGNALANTLTGNSGNNVLDGGAGIDTLVGGAGNDMYIVDNTADVVTEAASAGTDLVQASVTYTLATNVENLTLTGTSAINGTGNTLANVLTGNSANNTLDGGTGADTLIGGQGNDTYVVDNTGDVVTENASEGTDLIQSSVTYTLGSNVENLTLTGTGVINGTGNTLDNILTGNSVNNTLTGGAGNDTLDGGAGTDTMIGGTGNDVYYVDATTDVTTENANEGIDTVNSSVTSTLASNIELLFLTGTSANNGTGNTLANLLRGNTANNTLAGGGGTDILEGGDGNDILSNTSGNTFLNGGAGTDTLTGTANNDLLVGGTGNDAITTGQGADIIAFNKGDGQDTVAASTTKDNTLSIGGTTAYADLLFQKSGNDLILKVGASDQITFTGYYASTANHSVNTLQVILEGSSDYNAGSSSAMYNKKIESFNFDGLVSAFDAARTANPSLTTWALSGALAAQYLNGSDTAAMGGDLAYQYGRFGNEANVSYTPAIGILGSASFGTAVQALQSLTSLQDATPRLS